MTEIDLNQEGLEILKRSWPLFYNKNKNNFINPNKSDGSYSDDGRYTVWPVAVYVQAVIDAARIFPKEVGDMLPQAMRTFDDYYQPKYGGYCASYFFNENKDIYYDDNAQVASCYLSAHEVTHHEEYLQKAHRLVDFLMTGADRGKAGGVKWHIGKDGSNTCTTAEVGIACVRLYRALATSGAPQQVTQKYLDFGRMCANWIFTKTRCSDGLIGDGLEPDGNGGYKPNNTKWTYNQGTPITLCCLLHFYTREDQYLKWATELVDKVTDHNTAIFDRDTQKMDRRYYRDHTYFYQLLAEGFADYLLFFYDKVDKKYMETTTNEAVRELEYIYKYLRDDSDGLYFQSFEIFRIDHKRYEQFKELTGENKKYQPSKSEREHTKGDDLEKKKLVKCLIGCGSAARIFFQTARIQPKVKIN